MPQPNTIALVVLISGSGSNLQAIMDTLAGDGVSAEIKAVISNRADAYGLTRARNAGLETHVLDHKNYPDRESYDRELGDLIEAFRPDLVVLAGFMRILTPGLVARFSGRMINIHPSLLPRHRGLKTHRRALDAGDTTHGASVHFVTDELDGGPVIIQAQVPVRLDDTEESLADRVLGREHLIYPTVVRWFAEGRLAMSSEGRVLLDQAPLASPIMIEFEEPPPQ